MILFLSYIKATLPICQFTNLLRRGFSFRDASDFTSHNELRRVSLTGSTTRRRGGSVCKASRGTAEVPEEEVRAAQLESQNSARVLHVVHAYSAYDSYTSQSQPARRPYEERAKLLGGSPATPDRATSRRRPRPCAIVRSQLRGADLFLRHFIFRERPRGPAAPTRRKTGKQ